MQLVLFADYACPFCRLAQVDAERLGAAGRIVEHAPHELRPPGTPLPAVEAAWPAAEWSREVEPRARAAGVVMVRPPLVTRTRKAHEAAAYARAQDRFDAMHRALYDAYWAEGRDIGRIDVLVEIGASAGLDAGGLRVALDIDQHAGPVAAQLLEAERLALPGVPAWLRTVAGADGTAVAAGVRAGLQDYEELRAWVEDDNDL